MENKHLNLQTLEIAGITNILADVLYSNYGIEFEKSTSISLRTLEQIFERLRKLNKEFPLEDCTTTIQVSLKQFEIDAIECAIVWCYRKVEDWEFPTLIALTKQEMEEVQRKLFGRIATEK